MYRALKPMTLNGVHIQPGEPVNLAGLLEPIKEARITSKLIEQKRIVFVPDAPEQHKAAAPLKRGPGRPRKHPVEV